MNDIHTYMATTLPPSVVWVDACSLAGHTVQLANVDDCAGTAVTLPFTFRFFDGIFMDVTPTADGYIGFGPTFNNSCSYGAFAPPMSTRPNPAFFYYARDLYQRAGGICMATMGTAPNRVFVHEMNDAYNYFDATTHLTIETFLNEGSNTIDVIYQTLTGTGTDGSTSMVGGQNLNATRSFTYESSMAGSLSSGLRVRFQPM
jgi:hypothetical protein